MQFQSLTLLALATYTLASPTPNPQYIDQPPTLGNPLGIRASGSSIQNLQLTASGGRIFIGGSQDPVCDGGQRQDFATFVTYSDKSLYLYKLGNPPQQVWVDASGMGGGITGFVTGDATAPKNASREGFAVDADGFLTFNGVGAKACPTNEDGKWSVWFTESEKPGFQDGCVSVSLKAYDTPARIACTYSDA